MSALPLHPRHSGYASCHVQQAYNRRATTLEQLLGSTPAHGGSTAKLIMLQRGGGGQQRNRVSEQRTLLRDKSKAKTHTDMAQHGWSWMMQAIKTLSCLTFFCISSGFTLSPLSHQPGCRTPTSQYKAGRPASLQKDDDVHVAHSYKAAHLSHG